jgi:hypothetical protein
MKPPKKPVSTPGSKRRRDGQSLQRLDEEKLHQEASQHVDTERRVTKIPAVDRLNEVRHPVSCPAAQRAAHRNRDVSPHNVRAVAS